MSGYAIPFASGKTVTLEGPFPITAAEWDYMLTVLQAMRPGLVTGPADGAG